MAPPRNLYLHRKGTPVKEAQSLSATPTFGSNVSLKEGVRLRTGVIAMTKRLVTLQVCNASGDEQLSYRLASDRTPRP